jgi:hypothetical protein
MGLLAPPWAIRKGLEKALVGLSAEQRPQALAFALSEAKTTAQKVALMASITQHLAFEGNGTDNLCMYTSMLLPVTGMDPMDPMDPKLIEAAGLLLWRSQEDTASGRVHVRGGCHAADQQQDLNRRHP